MEKLTSILVILDHSSRDASLLAKSIVLGREFGARIELFACDARYEYTLRHVYDERVLAEARHERVRHVREYLQQLRDQLAAESVEISIDAACECPLYEGILRKICRSAPDLVMKAAALEPCEGRGALDVNDWQLVRVCPVSLMLSHGGIWPPRPRLAAAVDVADEEVPRFAEIVLRTAEYLRAGCQGELDIVLGERIGNTELSAAIVGGRQHHDVVVLGARTHQIGPTASVGTRACEMMNTLPCDFLLVRPSSLVCPKPPTTH